MSSTDKLRQGGGNGIAHAQPVREFYPAPHISEQTIDGTEGPITPAISDNDCMKYSQLGNVFRKRGASSIGRELGLNECVYFRQALKKADVISLMMHLETIEPVTEVAVRHAIENLMKRHPLLRMSVARKGGSYYMYEGVDEQYDFKASSRKDWTNVIKEELDIPFSENGGLLWRIRLLNSSEIERPNPPQQGQSKVYTTPVYVTPSHTSSSQCSRQSDSHNQQSVHDDSESGSSFRYQARFLFIFNHTITDGGYTMWLFQEFVNFIDAYNMGVDIAQIKRLPLLPPSEKCLSSLHGNSEVTSLETSPDVDGYVTSASYLSFCYGQGNPDMLNKYTLKYRHEIQSLSSRSPKNNFIFCRFTKADTRMFTNACKSHGVKADTAVVTASLLAFIDLLYAPTENQSEFEIPFEYMSDTRRKGHFEFPGNDQFLYPGLASLAIPLKARIQLTKRPVPMKTFWEISRAFNKTIKSDIQAKETIQMHYEEARKNTLTQETKGKSPFVLCFSNMGKLDGVFNNDVSKRFRLVDLLGQSSILTDDMPLFFVNTFALNGQLFGSVNFCDGFTSESTANAYLALLQKYLTMSSKL